MLLQIENEDQIKVPKDIGASVRALKQMLDHPLIFREPCKELEKPQVALRTSLSKEKHVNNKIITQPKLAQVTEILDNLKERKTISEVNLTDALLKVENTKDFERAKRLLEKVGDFGILTCQGLC